MESLGVIAEAKSVSGLLQSGKSYRIPTYQRSYSWQIADACALIHDIVQAMDEERPHFMGAVVTCQTAIPDLLEIIDGQQRITTVSLVLACLRDLLPPGDTRDELQSALANKAETGGWKLTLNHVDAPVFRALAQKMNSTLNSDRSLPPNLSKNQLVENMVAIRDELKSLSAPDRQKLAEFLLKQCPIVHVEVENRDDGYKVFQVLNTRGLQPSAHDILKTELFERARLDSEQADRLARAWTQHEARLGAADFDDLLRQIRSLHDRQMRGNFVSGFCNTVLEAIPPKEFLERYLPRFVDAYQELRQGQIHLSRPIQAVNDHLARLISLDHSGWRAPALQFLVFHPRDADTAREFFCDLERLAFTMQLVVTDRDNRARRYRRLSEEIVSKRNLFASDGALSLSVDERAKLTQRLYGRFGSVTQRRALALKLNCLLDGGENLPATSEATVEHVLPRNPEPGTEWLSVWPDLVERREICESIGNFCLLSKRDNQQADRLEFREKRDRFFRDPERGGQFALTRDAAQYDEWTSEIVRARTARLADLLIREWKLDLAVG
ncbi:DUF262 domain-containing HNH endonuclease family protein [Ponticaulis sp.]|uniref:DUF262 domain-containing protein n=1 Tax=Ponticaulis sp. TaxID=2020902 RepID=UPI000B766DD8|nr:DUF262 domain-containing HNH endonuclease family protein [Ponticaulis sp.]MAJ09958.1 hypothetical protein [Ponticaulis sp.]RPG18567.1 MAG: DUF262 domain-containing protein [Hyphomonadaceae bacterium TMED125]|tara:strand:+ start:32968 stop:34629 length:1662 start_codon:yes stop_codon:yes gene_type:complete